MLDAPLQYRISDWHQAIKCQSNLSPDLKISVGDLIQNRDITGIRISVEHRVYGNLFTCLTQAEGVLVNEDIPRSLNMETVLNELERFGFYIQWVEEPHISAGVYELLSTIRALNYDKVRMVCVHESSRPDVRTNYIAAFSIDKLPGWINASYSPSSKEWESAIVSGNALNISNWDKGSYDWSWLYNSIYDIDQLVEEYDGLDG